MKYSKILNLYHRGNDGVIIPKHYQRHEFKNLRGWIVQEKLDGMNIRIMKNLDGEISYNGRTDKAELPKYMVDFLEGLLDETRRAKIQQMFIGLDVVIYGEGIGRKIQSNPYDMDGHNFIAFDVMIDGVFVGYEAFLDIITEIGFNRVAVLGRIQESSEAEHYVTSNRISSYNGRGFIEGVICKAEPLLYYKNVKPLYFKLKRKDWINYERQQEKLDEGKDFCGECGAEINDC